MDAIQAACTENDGAAPGLFWHEEVFRSAATPCVSCVPGRYQQAGEITCLQCEAGFTTDSLSASGGTFCSSVAPGWFDHDSVYNGDADGYCRAAPGAGATCTGTATDAVATPDCAAAFGGAGDTLAASCPAGCTYVYADPVRSQAIRRQLLVISGPFLRDCL